MDLYCSMHFFRSKCSFCLVCSSCSIVFLSVSPVLQGSTAHVSAFCLVYWMEQLNKTGGRQFSGRTNTKSALLCPRAVIRTSASSAEGFMLILTFKISPFRMLPALYSNGESHSCLFRARARMYKEFAIPNYRDEE